MSTLLEELRAAGVKQRDLAAATGETEATVSRRLHGIQPMTGALESAARLAIRRGLVTKAREGIAALEDILRRF